MQNLLREEFIRHQYLLDNDRLSSPEKRYIQPVLEDTAKPGGCSETLRYLSEFLSRVHQAQVVILVDEYEYDMPIQAGYFSGYYTVFSGYMAVIMPSRFSKWSSGEVK